MKKILAMLLALSVALTFVVMAFASGTQDGVADTTVSSSDESTTKASELPSFLQEIIKFFETYIVDAVKKLVESIVKAINGPALPWPSVTVPATTAAP